VCACALWKFKTMQCAAGADSVDTAWNKLRVQLAHLLYLFNIWVLIKHYTIEWWPTSRFRMAGTSYTHHSQLFSKKKLWNGKVAKEPKSSHIAKYKFCSQLLLKRAKFLAFGSKRANLATLLQVLNKAVWSSPLEVESALLILASRPMVVTYFSGHPSPYRGL